MHERHGLDGYKPESNCLRANDFELVGQKQDKVFEIFKQSTEIHNLIEDSKDILAERGLRPDAQSVCEVLFSDHHFLNRKFSLGGNLSLVMAGLLNKKPGAKKVSQFLLTQLQRLFDELRLDTNIESKFSKCNSFADQYSNIERRMQSRVDKIHRAPLIFE